MIDQVPLMAEKQGSQYCCNCEHFIDFSKDVAEIKPNEEVSVQRMKAAQTLKSSPVAAQVFTPLMGLPVSTSIETQAILDSLNKTLSHLKSRLDSVEPSNIDELSRVCLAIHHCAQAITSTKAMAN